MRAKAAFQNYLYIHSGINHLVVFIPITVVELTEGYCCYIGQRGALHNLTNKRIAKVAFQNYLYSIQSSGFYTDYFSGADREILQQKQTLG